MATVPTYDSPQVAPQALPGVRVDSIASPDLLDAGARQNEDLGKAEQVAGAGLGAIAYHMQQRENDDAINRVESARKAEWIKYEQDVRDNKQGAYAKGVTTDTAQWWKEGITKDLDALGNSEQKRVYSRRAAALQLQSLSEVSKFESQQMEVSYDQSWKANKLTTIDMAAANPSPDVVASSIAQLRAMNERQGARKGWTGEDGSKILAATNAQDITNLHKQVIQTLAVKNPALAETYYKEHEQEIEGSQRAEIGLFAEKATAITLGAAAAQKVWDAMGPKNDTAASDIDKMKAKIREDYKDNTFVRDAALHEISQIDADRDKGTKARDEVRMATVNGMFLQGYNLAQVQRTPAWFALNGTQQGTAMQHASAMRSAQQHQLNEEGLDTMLRLADPMVLAGMSRDAVVNQLPIIGNANTVHLVEKWDLYHKDRQALMEAKIDNDQFNVIAKNAGLDPFSKSDKDRMAALRDNLERTLQVEQTARNKPLNRAEKDELIKKTIHDEVMTNRFLFDWTSKTTPISTLGYDSPDLQKAYVRVPDAKGKEQKVMLKDIDDTWTKQVIADRRRAGLGAPAAKDLAKWWLQRKPNG